MAKEFQLSHDDQAELLQSGQPRLYNRVGWATTYLKKAGLLQAVGPGRFQVTDRGRDVLASRPAAINVAFLESRFPEMSAFRKARSKGEVADEEPSGLQHRRWHMEPARGRRGTDPRDDGTVDSE